MRQYACVPADFAALPCTATAECVQVPKGILIREFRHYAYTGRTQDAELRGHILASMQAGFLLFSGAPGGVGDAGPFPAAWPARRHVAACACHQRQPGVPGQDAVHLTTWTTCILASGACTLPCSHAAAWARTTTRRPCTCSHTCVPEIVHIVPQALLHAAEANPHKQFYIEAVLIYAATPPAPEAAAVTFQSLNAQAVASLHGSFRKDMLRVQVRCPPLQLHMPAASGGVCMRGPRCVERTPAARMLPMPASGSQTPDAAVSTALQASFRHIWGLSACTRQQMLQACAAVAAGSAPELAACPFGSCHAGWRPPARLTD